MYLSTLNGAISDTDENFLVLGTNGMRKGGGFYLIISNGSDQEVVRVISRSGKLLFVERGVCGSTALAWADDSYIRDVPQDFIVAGTNITMTYDPDSDSTLLEAIGGGASGDPLDVGNHEDINVSTLLPDTDLTLSAKAFAKMYIRMSLNLF